jgi:EspA-like secreted protein
MAPLICPRWLDDSLVGNPLDRALRMNTATAASTASTRNTTSTTLTMNTDRSLVPAGRRGARLSNCRAVGALAGFKIATGVSRRGVGVGVLDGFLSAWSNARNTFGQGAPPSGEQYDNSARLRQMQATVQSAKPGSAWSGSAATAYDTVNTHHGKVFDELAVLDQRLGATVTQCAQVVGTGRDNLDAVRRWVLDAAAAMPPGNNREQLLMPIVAKGLGQLTDIVTTANGELSTIGAQVRTIAGEYQKLGNQKFAAQQSENGGPRGVLGRDDEKDEEDEKKGVEDGTDQGHHDGESLADGQLPQNLRQKGI